ncbi:MAG: lamin tail domain-containing protein, partial [Candidatus Methanospirareceae archaeon]
MKEKVAKGKGGRERRRGRGDRDNKRWQKAIIGILLALIMLLSVFSMLTRSASGKRCLDPSMFENVLITEVYYDTFLEGDVDGEFIKIYNPTKNAIDIGGWEITDREGVIKFPEWARIGAEESLYLAYNATAFYEEMLKKADFEYGVDSDETPNMINTYRSIKLANTGDEVILRDGWRVYVVGQSHFPYVTFDFVG